MGRVRIEVITYAPTVFFHCQHCELTFAETGVGARVHREQAREALPEDLRREFGAVADWLHDLLQRHGSRVAVRVVDAASIEGVWRSLRTGVRRYPAVVIDGRERYVGPDLEPARLAVERRLAAGVS